MSLTESEMVISELKNGGDSVVVLAVAVVPGIESSRGVVVSLS